MAGAKGGGGREVSVEVKREGSTCYKSSIFAFRIFANVSCEHYSLFTVVMICKS